MPATSTLPNARLSSELTQPKSRPAPMILVYCASNARHQNLCQPTTTIAAGMRNDAYPSSWNDSSARNAPTRPAKFTGCAPEPALKNHTGSVGS